jgi:two-component system nitrate/nitrite response regulator NarL
MAEGNLKPRGPGNDVILAHPHTLIREGIVRILREGGFNVLGQADDLPDLHRLASQHQPDIVILDWEISSNHTDAVKGLSKTFPGICIVVLTRPQASGDFLEALAAGAGGYLSVNLSPEDFVQSLHMLARGSLVVAKEKIQGEEVELNLEKPPAPSEELSERETEVLALVGKGETNREIAEDLIISENTVKIHLRSILSKLDLRNRQQAASYATKVGLVKDNKPEENRT